MTAHFIGFQGHVAASLSKYRYRVLVGIPPTDGRQARFTRMHQCRPFPDLTPEHIRVIRYALTRGLDIPIGNSYIATSDEFALLEEMVRMGLMEFQRAVLRCRVYGATGRAACRVGLYASASRFEAPCAAASAAPPGRTPASPRSPPSLAPVWAVPESPFSAPADSHCRLPAAPSADATHSSSPVPESSLRPHTRAAALQIVPLFVSCPFPNLLIRGCPGGPNQAIKVAQMR